MLVPIGIIPSLYCYIGIMEKKMEVAVTRLRQIPGQFQQYSLETIIIMGFVGS